MSSPFSGMDPYLEGDLWQEFHDRLANQISAQLMPRLAPRYVALLAKRYVVDRPGLGLFQPPEQRTFYPDVHVARTLREWQVATLPPGIMAPTVELASPTVEEVPLLGVEIRVFRAGGLRASPGLRGRPAGRTVRGRARLGPAARRRGRVSPGRGPVGGPAFSLSSARSDR